MKDPSKREGDWAAKVQELKQKFIQENDLNTQLSLMSFDNELTKHNTQHFNIFRHSNVAALSRETINKAFEAHHKPVIDLFNGGQLKREGRRTESGDLIPDENGNPIPGPPSVIMKSESIEEFIATRDSSTTDEGRSKAAQTVGESVVAYLEENNPTLDREEARVLITRIANAAIGQSFAAYVDAQTSEVEGKIEDAFNDLRFAFAVVQDGMTKTTGKDEGRTSIWDADTQTHWQDRRNRLELRHHQTKNALKISNQHNIREHYRKWLSHLDMFKDAHGQWITDFDAIQDILKKQGVLEVDAAGEPLLTSTDLTRDEMVNGLTDLIQMRIYNNKDREERERQTLASKEQDDDAKLSRDSREFLIDAIDAATTLQQLDTLGDQAEAQNAVMKSKDSDAVDKKWAERQVELEWFDNSRSMQASLKALVDQAMRSPAIRKAIHAEKKRQYHIDEKAHWDSVALSNPKHYKEMYAEGGITAMRNFALDQDKYPPFRKGVINDNELIEYWRTNKDDTRFREAAEKAIRKFLRNQAIELTDQQAVEAGMTDAEGKPTHKTLTYLNGGNRRQMRWTDEQQWSNSDIWPHMDGNEGYVKGDPNTDAFNLDAAPTEEADTDPSEDTGRKPKPPTVKDGQEEDEDIPLSTASRERFEGYSEVLEATIETLREEAEMHTGRARRGLPERSWLAKLFVHPDAVPRDNPTIARDLHSAALATRTADVLEGFLLGPNRLALANNGARNAQRLLASIVQGQMSGDSGLINPDGTVKDPQGDSAIIYKTYSEFVTAGRGSWVGSLKDGEVYTPWGVKNIALFGAPTDRTDNGHPIQRTPESVRDEVVAAWDNYFEKTDINATNKFLRIEQIFRDAKYTGVGLEKMMLATYNYQLVFAREKKYIEQPMLGHVSDMPGRSFEQTKKDFRTGADGRIPAGELKGHVLRIEQLANLVKGGQRRIKVDPDRGYTTVTKTPLWRFTEDLSISPFIQEFIRHHDNLVQSGKFVSPLGIGMSLLTDKGTREDLERAIREVPSWNRDLMFEVPTDGTPLKDQDSRKLILLPLKHRQDKHDEAVALYAEYLQEHGINPLQFGSVFRPTNRYLARYKTKADAASYTPLEYYGAIQKRNWTNFDTKLMKIMDAAGDKSGLGDLRAVPASDGSGTLLDIGLHAEYRKRFLKD